MRKLLIFLLVVMIPFITFALPVGDVDGNGVVQTKDYLKIRKHLLSMPKLTGDELKRADVNGDGVVSQKDYNLIRRIQLGLPVTVTTPVPTAVPTPVPTAVPTPVPTPAPYVITNDSKYNKYSVVASCNSNTLKYKILKHTDDYNRTHYVTILWVADAYYQMNIALAYDGAGSTARAPDILGTEKRKYFSNYSSGCMVAVNASFFNLNKGQNKNNIVLSKGKVYRNSGNEALLGFTSDYKFKYFRNEEGNLSAFQNVGIRNTFSISHWVTITYKNGKYYQSGAEAGKGSGVKTTQICQYDKNNYVLITGYDNSAVELYKVTGCSSNIYNLDGSDSSKLYYQSGSEIKEIRGSGRKIADMLYFSEHRPTV